MCMCLLYLIGSDPNNSDLGSNIPDYSKKERDTNGNKGFDAFTNLLFFVFLAMVAGAFSAGFFYNNLKKFIQRK